MRGKRLKTLDRLKFYKTEVSLLDERIKALESAEVFITSHYRTGGSGGSAGDGKNISVKLMDLRTKLSLARIEYEYMLQEAEKLILMLEPDQARVVFLRYRDGMSWGRIIRKMNYSEASVFRIHAKALENLVKLGME